MRISLAQLAANVGRSERTVLRWIEQGKLQAKRLPDGKYEVSDMDITADGGIEERLERIETTLAQILDLLRGEQTGKQIAAPVRVPGANYKPSTPEPVVLKPPVPAPSVPKPPADLPDGTLTLAEMARELGISRTTLLGHCKHLAHESRPLQRRPGEHARFFTPEQADAARAWHAEHSKK